MHAHSLGAALKLGILEAPPEDKVTYIETAKALEYILKAVSSNKQEKVGAQLKKV